MSTYTFSGITYDSADLLGSDGRGYDDPTTTGTGETNIPLYVAPMIDALADLANAHITTSTSSVIVGTGSKVFVLAADIPLVAGEKVFIIDRDAPTTNTMFGTVTTWVSATKTATINVNVTSGSGTLSNWDFVGKVGPSGDLQGSQTGDIDPNGFSFAFGTGKLLSWAGTGSGVNAFTISNAVVSGNPKISATGSDTNINLELEPKGTGGVILNGNLENARRPILTKSGTITLALADEGVLLKLTSGGATTIGVPPNSTIPFDIGTEIELFAHGTGTFTVSAGVGVTVLSKSGLLTLNGQYSGAVLKKLATDEWLLLGDLA